MITIKGYDLLGHGKDGVRFAWQKDDYNQLIESAAFVNKTKNVSSDICGYTTSVSMGCILSKTKQQCKFCRTGNNLVFYGMLSDIEIAKQNVFMVLADLYCDEHPELKTKKREFAYMGQGEPGFSYDQVRSAIEITNSAMRKLGQTVFRHVLATSGVPYAIRRYAADCREYFSERVSLHFSLHATTGRSLIMPINDVYSYQECISELNCVSEAGHDKPCVGIMLFKDFSPLGTNYSYSNTKENILSTLQELDSKKCRLSFCEFNLSPELGEAKEYGKEEARHILQLVESCGFEAKLFSSFGRVEQSACGMLGGKEPENNASPKWAELDDIASDLVEMCSK